MSRKKGLSNYSQEFWEQINKDYTELKLSTRQIGKKYNISAAAVSYHLRKQNTSRSKQDSCKIYKRNSKFFDTWTQDSVYTFGFICADGSQIRDSLVIGIHAKDREILDYIGSKIFIDTPPIKERSATEARGPQVWLTIYDKYLSERLRELNFRYDKTHNLTFPSFIPEKFMPDFFRGYFDGDGTLARRTYTMKTGASTGKSLTGHTVSFVSTESFCNDALEYLRNKLQVGGFISKGKNCWNVVLGGRLQGRKFLNWIYQDPNSFRLQRKYQRFLKEF